MSTSYLKEILFIFMILLKGSACFQVTLKQSFLYLDFIEVWLLIITKFY